MQFQFRHLATAAIAPLAVGILSLAYTFIWNYMLPVHALLQARNVKDVRITEPVSVDFDKRVDESRVKFQILPATAVRLSWSGDRVTLRPKVGWQPGARYVLRLKNVPNAVHTQSLKSWTAHFQTQPHVGVAGFAVDGAGVKPGDSVKLRSPIRILFTVPMNEAGVRVTIDGQPAQKGTWNKAGDQLDVSPPHPKPFQAVTVAVDRAGFSAAGDPFTDPGGISLNVRGLVPSNPSSGITGAFKTIPPILVVIENSPPARPQSGFQAADIVYEYISEYSISRMTAIYFNQPPGGDIGPVRSCRLINLFLPFAYGGVNLCSGASAGTEHLLFSRPFVPALQDPFAPQYFFRVGFNVAPHNLYTNGGRALVSRHQWPLPPPPYEVDPPHPDNGLGSPAPAPAVPLHGVAYSYDAGSRQYLRFDDGAPFVDASTGHQLHVKNVVMIHVGFHKVGYVEDESGGALSVWYDMVGSGPAEIYSDGRLIHATWHMGRPGQRWSDNHQPVYFTDAQGNFIELNSGLTWIHVLGNGQTS